MAQAPLVIKFSHVVANDTPKGKASGFFAKRAGELTGGKVKVEVYANSTLYKDKEEMEALQVGAVQMLAPSLAKFGPLGVREFEVFDLPFIFDDARELHAITAGPVGKQLFARLETKGITGLAYWDNGFKSFSANKPLKTSDDFKGLNAMKLGIDPIHFGVMITVNMEIGMITPPVGLNLYVASGISKLGLSEMTVAVWPWLLTMLVFLVLITYWPPLTLWLPRTLGMM